MFLFVDELIRSVKAETTELKATFAELTAKQMQSEHEVKELGLKSEHVERETATLQHNYAQTNGEFM